MEIILLIHVAVGIISFAVCFAGFSTNSTIRHISSRAFMPSIFAVLGSGFVLGLASGSLSRACVSGAATLTVLVGLRYLKSNNRFKIRASTRFKA